MWPDKPQKWVVSRSLLHRPPCEVLKMISELNIPEESIDKAIELWDFLCVEQLGINPKLLRCDDQLSNKNFGWNADTLCMYIEDWIVDHHPNQNDILLEKSAKSIGLFVEYLVNNHYAKSFINFRKN
jgi:hypothetical protein